MKELSRRSVIKGFGALGLGAISISIGSRLILEAVHDDPNPRSSSYYRVVQASESCEGKDSENMPCMPEMMSKGRILKKLDAISRDAALRESLLTDLKSDLGVAAIGRKFGLTAEEESHVLKDWFTNWWPAAQPVEPIVRAGLIVALEESKSRGLPIDSYWVCHPGHDDAHQTAGIPMADDHIEVLTAWSGQQVTLTFHTPDPPTMVDVNTMTAYENIKVVKRLHNGEVVMVQPKYRPV